MFVLKQKKLMSYVYNYLRYPLSVFSCSIIYYNHILNKTSDVSGITIFYVIAISFFNSAFFNKLTLENSIESYYKKIIRLNF